jgi:hypothetical protein
MDGELEKVGRARNTGIVIADALLTAVPYYIIATSFFPILAATRSQTADEQNHPARPSAELAGDHYSSTVWRTRSTSALVSSIACFASILRYMMIATVRLCCESKFFDTSLIFLMRSLWLT